MMTLVLVVKSLNIILGMTSPPEVFLPPATDYILPPLASALHPLLDWQAGWRSPHVSISSLASRKSREDPELSSEFHGAEGSLQTPAWWFWGHWTWWGAPRKLPRGSSGPGTAPERARSCRWPTCQGHSSLRGPPFPGTHPCCLHRSQWHLKHCSSCPEHHSCSSTGCNVPCHFLRVSINLAAADDLT